MSSSTSHSVKRKKGGEKSGFHQSQSVAYRTNIVDDDDDDDDDRPVIKKRTIYVAEPEIDILEDTDTLARAAQLDGFTYLLGESVFPAETSNDFNDSVGINVHVQHSRKQYASTVSTVLQFLYSIH